MIILLIILFNFSAAGRLKCFRRFMTQSQESGCHQKFQQKDTPSFDLE